MADSFQLQRCNGSDLCPAASLVRARCLAGTMHTLAWRPRYVLGEHLREMSRGTSARRA